MDEVSGQTFQLVKNLSGAIRIEPLCNYQGMCPGDKMFNKNALAQIASQSGEYNEK